jgi:hypothetical protein
MPIQPQQPSQAELEALAIEFQKEKARLRDEAEFRMEILFQMNRLNFNIEQLVKMLGEGEEVE